MATLPKRKKRLTEQVGEFFKTLGNKVTRKGFGDVVIDENGIQDSIAHGLGRAKSITFAAVPDIIKKGKQIDYQNQWKGRNYDTVVFAGPVEVANHKGFVAAVVIKKDTSNRYYLHEIVDSTGNIFKIKNGTEKAFKTGFIAENGAAGANSVPKISSGSNTDVPEFNQINEPVGSPSKHVQDVKPSAYNNIIEYGGEKFNGNVDKTVNEYAQSGIEMPESAAKSINETENSAKSASAQERLKIQTTDPDAYRLGFIDLKQNKATNKILMEMKKAYRKQNYANGKGNTESIRKKFYSVSK